MDSKSKANPIIIALVIIVVVLAGWFLLKGKTNAPASSQKAQVANCTAATNLFAAASGTSYVATGWIPGIGYMISLYVNGQPYKDPNTGYVTFINQVNSMNINVPGGLVTGQVYNIFVRTYCDSNAATSTYYDTPVNTYTVPAGYTGTGGTTSNAPTVSISSPANGSTVSGSVNVSATSSASATFALSIDNRSVKTSCKNVTSCSYTWNTSKISAGAHTIKATATNSSGSGTASVTVNK